MNPIQALRHHLKFLPLERPKKPLDLISQGQYETYKRQAARVGDNRVHLPQQVKTQLAVYESYATAKTEYNAKRTALLQDLNALVLAQNTPSDLE